MKMFFASFRSVKCDFRLFLQFINNRVVIKKLHTLLYSISFCLYATVKCTPTYVCSIPLRIHTYMYAFTLKSILYVWLFHMLAVVIFCRFLAKPRSIKKKVQKNLDSHPITSHVSCELFPKKNKKQEKN